jgi:hypothetical protein
MMGGERASVFDDELDISGFVPKADKPPALPLEKIRAVSEEASFRSREPRAAREPAPHSERERRRFRTGRNVQLNIKARPEAIDAFYALADREGWVLGEAFEHAVEALERALASKNEASGEGGSRRRRSQAQL